jgi:hypothetical protein
LPRKTEWTLRLDNALTQLRQLRHPRIDRAALEQLLGLSPRQALRILTSLGAQQAGKSLSMDRLELIAKFEAIRQGETVQTEVVRLERVHEELRRARQRQASGRLALPTATQPSRADFASLAPGIRLAPGRLEITFNSGEELLGRLFELLQAVNDDVDRFLAVSQPPQRE